jgi:hypothetical protein
LIRKATRLDIPRIMEIRAGVRENKLRDPSRVTIEDVCPPVTNGYGEIEFVVTPKTTHILILHIDDDRRIFADGRGWPEDLDPTFSGIPSENGRYGWGRPLRCVRGRNSGPFKGPRTFAGSGLPLYADNETVIKERIYIDKADPNALPWSKASAKLPARVRAPAQSSARRVSILPR